MPSNEADTYQALIEDLMYLKLDKLAEELPQIMDKVNRRELNTLEALYLLINKQAGQKKLSSIRNKIMTAGFPHLKELKDFDFTFQAMVNKSQIYDLATLEFTDRAENIVFLGSPGVGKTHLATALGIEAAKKGALTYFIKAHELLAKLRQARDENRLESSLRYYNRYKLLIIDELGFLPILKGDEKILFQIIDKRYEKKSVIVTSNVQFSDWGDLFEDPTIASAILDRLLHHSHVITIVGDSYRTKDLMKKDEEISIERQ
jgi:DNA replication protein DnaC